MQFKNKLLEAFFILLLSVGGLVILSFTNSEFNFYSYKFKKADILSDIKSHNLQSTQVKDSLIKRSTIVQKNNVILNVDIQDFSDDYSNIKKFLSALKNIEQDNSTVRIAYFGDSIIEGDLITQDLRENLQSKFGGGGVGFVPITSFVSQFRNSIHHSFSDNWQTISLLNNNSKKLSIGICGYSFIPAISDSSSSSWVDFKASFIFKHLNSIDRFKLFYQNPNGNSSIEYVINQNNKNKVDLNNSNGLNTLQINLNESFCGIKINFINYDTLLVYGASFENSKGVILDNFAMRGNSGLPIRSISRSLLREFNVLLNYKLIVLQFGVNVADPSMTDYSWYRDGMIRTVNYLKELFPESAILIISIPDRASKTGLEYETAECVPYLLKAQEEVARKTQVAYWNLFDAMGGYNSMITWVNKTPALAAKDYTHLSPAGAKQVSSMLYKALLKLYNNIN